MIVENYVWNCYSTVSHIVCFKKILFEFFTIFFFAYANFSHVWILSVRTSVHESWETLKIIWIILMRHNDSEPLSHSFPALKFRDQSTSLFFGTFVPSSFLVMYTVMNIYMFACYKLIVVHIWNGIFVCTQ